MTNVDQRKLVVVADKVKLRCRKMPNWKAPGHDGVQGFWLKKLNSLHERIAKQLNDLLEGTEEIPG